ncbi:hypothetical protein V1511DRAFT_461673 [Dipodascopsis uninucleata]
MLEAAPDGVVVSQTQTRRKRLPQDIAGLLEDRLTKLGSQAPLSLYNSLIDEYRKRGKLDLLRSVFERSITAYPSVSAQWLSYLEFEQQCGEFVRADQLFTRAVTAVPSSFEVWVAYLDYVRRRNNIATDGATARNEILRAFELVTNKVGVDVRSGSVWREYISFVRDTPTGGSTWEEQQKMDLSRKVFQRAVTIPFEGLESVWSDYNAFENGLNKTTARKFISDKAPVYITARTALRELQNITNEINRDAVSSAPKWSSDAYYNQVVLFRRWISWEKSDPLGFRNHESPELGKTMLNERIMYAFRQALQSLRHLPQLWFEVAEYCASLPDEDLVLQFLKEGTAANPLSLLLNFRLAEVYEMKKKKEEAKKIYQALASHIIAKIKQVEDHCESTKRVLQNREETKSIYASGNGSEKFEKSDDDELEIDGELVALTSLDDSSEGDTFETRIKRVEDYTQERITILSKDFTMCNTMYMRAVKRMDGLKAARQVFSEARKSSYATYHIYVSSAMMEYHHNKGPDIASKIFEIGLKRFPETVEFIERYLDFLLLTNDDTNARALFERTLSKLSAQAARPLVRRFYEYEAAYGGELNGVLKLESRMAEMYPDLASIVRFAERYTFNGHSVIDERDVDPDVYDNILQEEEESDLEYDDDAMELVPTVSVVDASSKAARALKRAHEDSRSESRKRLRRLTAVGTSAIVTNTLPDGIMKLLSLLPPVSTYKAVLFDPDELIKLLGNTYIPMTPPPKADLSRFKKA